MHDLKSNSIEVYAGPGHVRGIRALSTQEIRNGENECEASLDLAQPHKSFLTIHYDGKWVDQVRLSVTTKIGRDDDNFIRLPEQAVSRHHCVIRWQDGQWHLTDLNSSNGTMVNGKKLQETTALFQGDVLSVGRYDLTVEVTDSVDEHEVLESFSTVAIESASTSLETVRVANYFSESELLTPSETVSGAYASLYRLAARLASINDATVQANYTLQELLRITEADLGAVLLNDGERPTGKLAVEHLSTVAFASNGSEVCSPSRTVSQLVLDRGEGILAVEIGDQDQFGSVKVLGGESAICVPIRFEMQTLGLIHIYSQDTARTLTRRELDCCLASADLLGASLQRTSAGQIGDLPSTVNRRASTFNRIIGESPAILQLRDVAKAAAETDAPVFIFGETGTGKTLLARTIHAASGRKSNKLVHVNCAELNQDVFQQMLTWSDVPSKWNMFQQADGGSLLLDNIDDLPRDLQDRLVAVLDQNVMGPDESCWNVRIIASSIKSPLQLLKSETIQADLLFRLNEIEIEVPSLRDRLPDVLPLLQHFVDQYSKFPLQLDQAAIAPLEKREWPGNVRQLLNYFRQRLLLLKKGELPNFDLDAKASVTDAMNTCPQVLVSLAEMEATYIQHVLKQVDGKKSRAASILGIGRSTLDRKIERFRDAPTPGATE